MKKFEIARLFDLQHGDRFYFPADKQKRVIEVEQHFPVKGKLLRKRTEVKTVGGLKSVVDGNKEVAFLTTRAERASKH